MKNLICQEKELIVIDPLQLVVGSHHPFTFRAEMTFLEGYYFLSSILIIDGLVTSYIKPPYGSGHQPFHGLLFLGNSKGNVYLIDLHRSSKTAMETIKVVKVFKTNPVSQALHFSRQRPYEDDFLLVGGEMSDTILYHVIFILVIIVDLDPSRSIGACTSTFGAELVSCSGLPTRREFDRQR
jgi:hypothetical protein